ncbi:MAG: glycosyltransferase [Tannerellaceae bacterium]|jgi:glycosyltransferase involved in cell wall biosynthesis|nr:glycosyltransferase [Tannerellaceae bacterium]
MNQRRPPLVTVITVNYNQAGALEKTIRSVVDQNYEQMEYIVVDGASTDKSVSVIRTYEDRIAAWVSEKDNGIYHAMNKGLGMATGKWCCFLNSGDVFAGNSVVRRVASVLLSHRPDVLYGNILVERPDGSLHERIAGAPCNKHRMYFCHQSAFVRTYVLRYYGFDETHSMSADLKFFKQCYHDECSFVHLPQPLVVYDTTGLSHTDRIRGLRDNIAVVKEVDRGIEKHLFLLRLYFVICWRTLTGKN